MRFLAPVLFGLCLAGYVVFMTAVGRFPATDEAYFKAAGREWAVSGRFAASEFPGFRNVDPPLDRIWFAYVPVYTFLFGILAKLVGFGWRQCVFYDALIHALLAWLTYRMSRRLSPTVPRWIAFLVGLAILPLGTWARPDELAMCFGMAGCLLLLHESWSAVRIAASGALLGLSAATSTGVAVALGMTGFFLLVFGPARPFEKVRLGSLWAGAAALVFAACIAPILVREPHAYQQYLTISRQVLGEEHILPGLESAWRYGKPTLTLVGVCLLLTMLGTAPLKVWLGAACGLAFCTVWLTSRYTYVWFVGPWLLSTAAVAVYVRSRRLPALLRPAPALVLSLGLFLGWLPFAKQTLEVLSLPREQQLGYNSARVHEAIPAGCTVLSDDCWWILAADHRVVSSAFSRPAQAPDLQYAVQTTIGSGAPGKPQELEHYTDLLERYFEPVYNNLNRQPLRFLGVPLSRSANGFGVLISASRESTP